MATISVHIKKEKKKKTQQKCNTIVTKLKNMEFDTTNLTLLIIFV